MEPEEKYQEIYGLIREKLKEIDGIWGARNQLAKKSGVGANLIYQIIHKTDYNPSFRTIYKIMYALLDKDPICINHDSGSELKYARLLNNLKKLTEGR